MKTFPIASILIISIIMISGCLSQGSDGEDGYDLVISWDGPDNITLARITEAEVTNSDPSNFIIKVHHGSSYLNLEGDLDSKRIKIDEELLKSMLLPSSLKVNEPELLLNIGEGDSISFDVRFGDMTGFHKNNVTVEDETGLKFRYQVDVKDVDLGSDGKIEVINEDIMTAPFDVNATQLISFYDQSGLGRSDPPLTRYWYPFEDKILELTDSEVEEEGYFVIRNVIFGRSNFQYDCTLTLRYPGGEVTFSESGEQSTISIGDHEYILASDNLYRETWFETYDVHDVPPARDLSSFYIIRKS